MADMHIQEVSLVLADISGYTHFVTIHGASVLHAEEIITELMEAVIDSIAAPLVVNKLEGDAAFLYAPLAAGDQQACQNVATQVQSFFTAFRQRQQALIDASRGGCFCDACCNLGNLRLKAIIHQGQAVFKKVKNLEELAGSDVILAHRLLKNTLTAKEYLLVTERFHQACGGLPELAGQTPEPHAESYEEIGEVKALVYYPPCPPLEESDTPRMTRPTAVVGEGGRLMVKSLWRRLWHPGRVFHHVPRHKGVAEPQGEESTR